MVTALAVAFVALQPLPASAAPPPAPRLITDELPSDGRAVEAPGTFDLAGVSFVGDADADVELRASEDGRTWTPWTHAEVATDEGPDRDADERSRSARHVTQPVWTGAADHVQVRVDGEARDLRLHAVDAAGHGESLLDKAGRMLRGLFTSTSDEADALTIEPTIVTREEWGADESIRRDDPSYGTVRFAVLHHTVHANDYSREEAEALVRSIYAYHVKSNGWDDIGYNFLVDRFGTIYEGRAGGVDRAVIGAHTEGFNTYSTGVAMLGTFTSVTPPDATLDAVERLMAWRLDVAHVDPMGEVTVTSRGSGRYPSGTSVTVDGIVGHRDLGQTSCPGELGYRQLAAIRTAVDGIGHPKIYAPSASPSTIEGRQKTSYEDTTITAVASGPLAWTVTIEGSRSGVVHTATSTGESFRMTWGGTDESGANVPPGSYTVTLAGVGATGPARSATLTVKVVDLDLLKPVVRLAGNDRYSTAAAAAARVAPTSTPNVVIAAGEAAHLVDSLVAGPLTAAKSAPLLLTTKSALPAATVGELDRLKPTTAWVVGGTAAVGAEVATALEARGMTVRRLAGVDAPATAATVAAEVGVVKGAIVVARERDHLVDGLAAAGPAAGLGRPILLVSRDSVPPATRQALTVAGPEVWAVGGPAAISDAVVTETRSRRIAGSDRWATAVAVAVAGRDAGVTPDVVVLASGETSNLVDALPGGSFAEAVVLTARSSLPSATSSYLTANRAAVRRMWVLGGTSAVGDAPLESARDAINQP